MDSDQAQAPQAATARDGDRAGLPRYDDLPAAPQGGRSGWGLFGPEDQVGLLNLQTPERVVAAARR